MKILNFNFGKRKLILLISILKISLLSLGVIKDEKERYKYLNYNNYIIKILKNSFKSESKEIQMKNLEEYKKKYWQIIESNRKSKEEYI